MKIGYLEIVTPEVDATCSMLEASQNVTFNAPEPLLGNARVAELGGGGKIGVRAPMSADEVPVARTYFTANDIESATAQAVAKGGELAHPVMELPGICKFSIVFQGSNQFGFWQEL